MLKYYSANNTNEELTELQEKLSAFTYYDQLIDIPLRTIFIDILDAFIKGTKKNGLKLAVLFLDVDNFKAVNDIYGHHIGDKLLKKIAEGLKLCIRSTDILCPMGGDEFAILIPGFLNINDIDKIAQRIKKLFNQPMLVSDHKLYTTASVGAAIYPNDGRCGRNLFEKAYIAMYKAKESGKNNFCYFDNDIGREASLRNYIKKDLKTAIEKGEFFLCYQPIIDIRTKKMASMEVLIRWRHPKKGIISPGKFITIAEETGLIIPIGEWVLKTSCSQLKEWHDIGYTDYGLSVNISVIQLQQHGFAEVVSRVLAETGLKSKYLELEITESAFMESNHTVTMNLIHLRKRGVKVSIDDFGTGYNSLKYLQEFSVNSLKIDRTFIFNIKADVNKVIIDTVISLGHKINAEITAEGVEIKEQYEYLKMKGCDKIQGYYFSKPLLPEEAIEFFKENNTIDECKASYE